MVRFQTNLHPFDPSNSLESFHYNLLSYKQTHKQICTTNSYLNLHVINPLHAHYWEIYSMKTKIRNTNLWRMWKFWNTSYVASNYSSLSMPRSIESMWNNVFSQESRWWWHSKVFRNSLSENTMKMVSHQSPSKLILVASKLK